MGAPIRDTDGEIVGALDLATPLEETRPERLALVSYVAFVIEELLPEGTQEA